MELDFSDREGNALGALKIKPSTILWKPAGAHRYRSVPLEKFAQWITDASTGADLVKF